MSPKIKIDFLTKIKEVLDEIRPMLQSHGGDIELINWQADKKNVQVRLVGGCASCPMAQITLKNLVEQTLKKRIPQIKKVESI